MVHSMDGEAIASSRFAAAPAEKAFDALFAVDPTLSRRLITPRGELKWWTEATRSSGRWAVCPWF